MTIIEVDIPTKSQRMSSRQALDSDQPILIEPMQEKKCFALSKLVPKSSEERRRIQSIHLEQRRMKLAGMKIISETSDSLKKDVLKDSSQLTKMQLRENLRKLRYDQSLIHQWGVYTTEPIRKNEAIIEYIGEIIRLRVADKRQIRYEAEGNNGSYIFQLEKDKLIDATHKGGLARFINHSCTPNCATQVKFFDNENHIIIYAKRDINPYEELCYDYKMEYEPKEKRIRCLCGSPNCKQWLNWSEKAEVELNYKWNNGTEHKRRFQSAPEDREAESSGSSEIHEACESNNLNQSNQTNIQNNSEQSNKLDQQNEYDEQNELDQQDESDHQNESSDISDGKHSAKRKAKLRRFDEFEQFSDSESGELNDSDDTDEYVFHKGPSLSKKKLSQKSKKGIVNNDKSQRSYKRRVVVTDIKQNMNVQQQIPNNLNFPLQITPEILSSTLKQKQFATFLKGFVNLMAQPNLPLLLQGSPQAPQKMTQCFEMGTPQPIIHQNQDIKIPPSVMLQNQKNAIDQKFQNQPPIVYQNRKVKITQSVIQQNLNVQNLQPGTPQNQKIEIIQSNIQQNQVKIETPLNVRQNQDIKIPPSVMLQNQQIDFIQSSIQKNRNILPTPVIIQNQVEKKEPSNLEQGQQSNSPKVTTRKTHIVTRNHKKKVVSQPNKKDEND